MPRVPPFHISCPPNQGKATRWRWPDAQSIMKPLVSILIPRRWIADAVKSVLNRFDYRIVHSDRSEATGFDFAHDIRLLVQRDSPACFDVGANEGQSIDIIRKIFKDPRIYAFEPSRESFRKLQSKCYGSEALLHNFAFGSQNSREEFVNYEDSCLSSFLPLDDALENRFRDVKVKQRETVDVRTIDWFVQQNRIDRIDLLKIDTQGYDLQVLRGAKESLKRGLIDNVLVELNFVKIYQNQSDAHQIWEFLSENDIHLVDYYEKVRQNHTLGWCDALFTKRQKGE